MNQNDYERPLVGLLCRHCREASRPSYRRQRRCPACHSVEGENSPFYLAEYEFPYNHRHESLLNILFEVLARSGIPT